MKEETRVSDAGYTPPRRAGRVVRGRACIWPSSGRARAEIARRGDAPAPTAWIVAQRRGTEGARRYGERWNSLPAEQQQRLLRGTRRWLAMTPEQRERAQARYRALAGTDARADGAGAQALARLPRAAARAAGSACATTITGFKKLTPEQRQRLRERWQNATPEERQRMLERRRQRHGTPAAPAAVANYCAVDGAGVGGIFLVLVPGLAQLIT